MKIYLGELGGRTYYLSLEPYENNNTLIVGQAGTGKTLFMKSILYRMVEQGFNENILILDFTGEYDGLPGFKTLYPGLNFYINPLQLPFPMNRDTLFYFIRYVFGREVTPMQFYVLSEMIGKCKNIRDIISSLRDEIGRARDDGWRNAYSSIYNRLMPLGEMDAISKITEIPDGYIHLNLSHMGDQQQTFFSIIILHYLYYLAKYGEYSAVIVIDEAERIALPLPGENRIDRNIVTKIVDELRKYGLFIFLISHTLHRMDDEIRNNVRNLFVFRLQNPRDVEYASKILFIKPLIIQTLPKFTAMHRDPYKTYIAERLDIEIEPRIVRKFIPQKPFDFNQIFEKARKKLLQKTIDKDEIELLKDPQLRQIYEFYRNRTINIPKDPRYFKEINGKIVLTNIAEKICRKIEKEIQNIIKYSQ